MKKIKICGISLCALLCATGANAAGYTCEELIEYTSCMPGYALKVDIEDNRCPEGHEVSAEALCYSYEFGEWSSLTEAECKEECFYDREEYPDTYGYLDCSVKGPGGYMYYEAGEACIDWEEYDNAGGMMLRNVVSGINGSITSLSQCNECPAGSACAGGTAAAELCASGTYQPNSKQASCIDAPAGSYVAGTGATSFTACAEGSYQPTVGQASCLECPAGSYCATTGLSAVSGQCTAGTFASVGASECSTCPEHVYVNANGQTVSVPATTVPEIGAGNIVACVIDSGKTFTDIKGTYHFKENCAYEKPIFKQACMEYQKIDASVDCDIEFDIDGWYACKDESGRLIFDPETGGIGCHTEDGYSSGCDLESLNEIKSHCKLTNGTYDPLTTKCICPSGTEWLCADHSVNGEEWDGLGCEQVWE